jgi:hypothetical protein
MMFKTKLMLMCVVMALSSCLGSTTEAPPESAPCEPCNYMACVRAFLACDDSHACRQTAICISDSNSEAAIVACCDADPVSCTLMLEAAEACGVR